jgi:hypothetical protein
MLASRGTITMRRLNAQSFEVALVVVKEGDGSLEMCQDV